MVVSTDKTIVRKTIPNKYSLDAAFWSQSRNLSAPGRTSTYVNENAMYAAIYIEANATTVNSRVDNAIFAIQIRPSLDS